MRILDLFCGLGGWSQAFKDRGHEVVTVDIEQKFNPIICKDIGKLTIFDLKKAADYLSFDVVLASPPCNCFSVASIGKHWNYDGTPKKTAKKAISLVQNTLFLIKELNPKFWVMENPRGMLRQLPFMKLYHRKTITQCQYGSKRMKPTDLWGKFPFLFSARNCKNGDSCHVSAPRGSQTGTQGFATTEERAKIPYGLSEEMCRACELAIYGRTVFVSPKESETK